MLNLKKIKRIKKIFNQNGFAILKNFVSKKLIDEMENDTQKLSKKIIKNKLIDVHYLKSGQLSSVHNILSYIPKYKKFATLTGLNKVFQEIFGPHSKRWGNLSYFYKAKKVGIETKPHQDNAYFNLNPCQVFTCWIPTNTVTKKNSAMYYYPGSQKEGLFSHNLQGNLGASLSISQKKINKIKKKYKKRYIEMEKGDCIIHSPLVVHGSESNKSNINRGSFNFSMKSKQANEDVAAINDHKKRLTLYLKKKKGKNN